MSPSIVPSSALSPEQFVDRKMEQEIFDDLLKLEDDARLLTIRDRAGRGKTSLLRLLRYSGC